MTFLDLVSFSDFNKIEAFFINMGILLTLYCFFIYFDKFLEFIQRDRSEEIDLPVKLIQQHVEPKQPSISLFSKIKTYLVLSYSPKAFDFRSKLKSFIIIISMIIAETKFFQKRTKPTLKTILFFLVVRHKIRTLFN